MTDKRERREGNWKKDGQMGQEGIQAAGPGRKMAREMNRKTGCWTGRCTERLIDGLDDGQKDWLLD